MKKLTALVLLASVGVASAASVDWLNSSARRTYIWDSEGNKMNGTAYLILASDLATITAPTETQTFEDLLGDYKLEEASISEGAYARAQARVDSDKLTSGTEYDFQVLIVDSEGKYYTSSVVKQVAYTNGKDDPTIVSFGQPELGATGTADASTISWADKPVYGGGGETIPEPATGALALAGVALLFKRRRA